MGSQPEQQTTATDPWKAQKNYLKLGFAEARDNYTRGANVPSYYQNSMDAIETRAREGSNLLRGAQSQAQNTLSGSYLNAAPGTNTLSQMAGGSYLNSNPYVDAQYNRAAGALSSQFQNAMSGIDSQYAKAGRYASGLHSGTREGAVQNLATGLGDLGVQIYGNNYAKERDLQMQAQSQMDTNYRYERGLQNAAISQAPVLANQDYYDLDRLYNISADKRNLRFNDLESYMSVINGNYGTMRTSTAPGASKGQNAIAGAGAGASVGTSIYPGWGTAAGAAVGGAMGYFS
ncbi:MAG: hypothetical protein ACTSXQ_00320 [Alphaproteobacteria bacterium]